MTSVATFQVGDRVELTVGTPAHGGHCVARVPAIPVGDGEHGAARVPVADSPTSFVVFVRHALPGERVLAQVTEVRRGYLRADAVRVLDASPDRVPAPCPYAHPDGCGGCDLQHATLAAQREWKAAVVREQLAKLAGLAPEEISDLGVRVIALPAPPVANSPTTNLSVANSPAALGEPAVADGLGWRSRVRYTVDAAGRPGLLKHRSHEVVPVARCLIAHPAIQALPVTSQTWPDDCVSTVASSTGDVLIGPGTVHERAVGREWTVPAGVFWQVHPAAPDVLADAVLDLLAPRIGETAWDLYGGVGLFAAAIGMAVGERGRVVLVESVPAAARAAQANLADLPRVEVVRSRVEHALRPASPLAGRPVDLVVLDPPRSGAGAGVVQAVAAARPRAVCYVACDPAALARDIATFRQANWRLAKLRAYDCFPMTQHVECVALLVPGP